MFGNISESSTILVTVVLIRGQENKHLFSTYCYREGKIHDYTFKKTPSKKFNLISIRRKERGVFAFWRRSIGQLVGRSVLFVKHLPLHQSVLDTTNYIMPLRLLTQRRSAGCISLLVFTELICYKHKACN